MEYFIESYFTPVVQFALLMSLVFIVFCIGLIFVRGRKEDMDVRFWADMEKYRQQEKLESIKD